MGFIAILWLCGLFLTGLNADPCPFELCTCDPIQIQCHSKGFHSLPAIVAQTNISYELLFFDGNHITTIPAGSLLHNLKELSFLSNPITTIDDDAFDDSATTLEILTFSKALFTRIPDAFLHLKALNYLYIYDTPIQDWNQNALINIGQTVNSLFLGNVGLQDWPLWIQYFSNLTELSISDSSFSSIPNDAFINITHSLKKLTFIGNKLTSIPRSLSNLAVLQFLAVQNTNITDLTWLPRSPNLSALFLSNNKISDVKGLSNSLRHLAGSLKFLDVQGNNLTSFPDLSFLTLSNDINMNHNQISILNNGSLPLGLLNIHLAFNYLPSIPHFLSLLDNVTYLSLQNNSINVIQGYDFPPSTLVAELGFNLITELNDTSFPLNSNILILTLNNNPIVSISNEAFKNLQQLETLNLQYTQLTRLPLTLNYLTSLSRFDISGSVDLVCTCLEKNLKPVLLNVSVIIGNCGESSIEDFFTNFVNNCPES